MDIRLKGNTISYALPYHVGKAEKEQAVRESRFGSRFTVAGIRQYMQGKEQKQVAYRRTMQDIEETKQYLVDYEERGEEPEKVNKTAYVTENSENVLNKESEITSGADKKSNGYISFYGAFDRFQAEYDVSENDEEIFYESVFQEFNEQWQGKDQAVSEKKSEVTREEKVDYSKLSFEERAKLFPPPTADQMAELKEYQKRMGYNESKMKSMKYEMTLYDEFVKEYDYRKKHCEVKDNIQKKQRDRER